VEAQRIHGQALEAPIGSNDLSHWPSASSCDGSDRHRCWIDHVVDRQLRPGQIDVGLRDMKDLSDRCKVASAIVGSVV